MRDQGLKPLIFICESEGKPLAGGVFSVNGQTGVYLLGATNEEGMKCKASYLVQWSAIEFLKEHGFGTYDLGGCNPNWDKGRYHFKKGVCGKNPALSSRIGIMEACNNPLSLIAVKTGDNLRVFMRWLRNRI